MPQERLDRRAVRAGDEAVEEQRSRHELLLDEPERERRRLEHVGGINASVGHANAHRAQPPEIMPQSVERGRWIVGGIVTEFLAARGDLGEQVLTPNWSARQGQERPDRPPPRLGATVAPDGSVAAGRNISPRLDAVCNDLLALVPALRYGYHPLFPQEERSCAHLPWQYSPYRRSLAKRPLSPKCAEEVDNDSGSNTRLSSTLANWGVCGRTSSRRASILLRVYP